MIKLSKKYHSLFIPRSEKHTKNITELLQMTDSTLSTQMKPLINLTKSAINIQNCSDLKTNQNNNE